MPARTGIGDVLLEHVKESGVITIDAAYAFLVSKTGGAKGDGSSTVFALVCQKKELRRARSPEGTLYLYRKGVALPEGFEDLGHTKLVVKGKRAPVVPISDDDDYLICIKWKDDETLTLTPAEAESLWSKLHRALRKG